MFQSLAHTGARPMIRGEKKKGKNVDVIYPTGSIVNVKVVSRTRQKLLISGVFVLSCGHRIRYSKRTFRVGVRACCVDSRKVMGIVDIYVG